MITVILSFIVFALLIFVLLELKKYVDVVKKEFKSNENIIKNTSTTDKALILYCPSLHESVCVVKDCIKDKLYSLGYSVYTNYPSNEVKYNFEEFKVICFITPVYMRKVSNSLCEIMVNSNFENKKILIVSVGKEMVKKEELNYMKGLLNKNNQISLIKTTKEEKKKIEDFICYSII